LHEAGQRLGQLERYTQAARDAIARIEVEVRVSKQNRGVTADRNGQAGGAAEQKMVEDLGDAHKAFNIVAGEFLEETGTGLSYRIERSRYYVKLFDDNVKLLRVRRVEGDQPYDQFIRRRLGSQFDFIDRLGIRYERATRAVETIDQSYLAIVQGRLGVIQAEIDDDTNKIQIDIQRIQEWGEFALLAALVPYYVVHLLEKLVPEQFIPGMTIALWACFAAFAFWRKTKVKRYSIIVILAGMALFLIHMFLTSENPRLRAKKIGESETELQNPRNDPRDVLREPRNGTAKPPDDPPGAAAPASNATGVPSER
jgi:hypothetical protein